MRKGMTVAFSEVEMEESENDVAFDVDDPEIWNTLDYESGVEVTM